MGSASVAAGLPPDNLVCALRLDRQTVDGRQHLMKATRQRRQAGRRGGVTTELPPGVSVGEVMFRLSSRVVGDLLMNSAVTRTTWIIHLLWHISAGAALLQQGVRDKIDSLSLLISEPRKF